VVAGLAAIGVAGGLAWWWLRDGGAGRGESERTTRRAEPGRGAYRSGRGLHTGGLRWLGQPGANPRQVAGRVTYRGQPVAGAIVELEASELQRVVPARRVVTDASGEFDFGLHAAVLVRVSANAADRAPGGVTVDLRDPTLMPAPAHLELVLGECSRTLSGIVHDAGGPVAGAAVRVETGLDASTRRWTRGDPMALAVSGTDGAYRMCLPPGECRMAVEAEGYAREELDVSGDKAIRRDVELSPEAMLAGVVLGLDDRPVSGALVTGRMTDINAHDSHDVAALSDQRGRFSIGGLAPARYALSARDAGLTTTEEVERLANAGGAGEEAVLRLQAAERIRGRVVEGDRPVAGAYVIQFPPGATLFTEAPVLPPAAVTGVDGTFVIDSFLRGPFDIHVREYDVLEPPARVASATGPELLVRVAALARVRGRVLRRGTPVGGAMVTVRSGKSGVGRRWLADMDGHYEIPGLPAGTHQIGARTEHASAHELPITLAAGQQVDGFDISLDVTGEIAGIVVDQRAQPVGGATVTLRSEGEPRAESYSGSTGDDGSFTIGGLAAGEYVASVRMTGSSAVDLAPAAGSSLPRVRVTDGPGRDDPIRIAVQLEWLQLKGTVLQPGGDPAADVRVKAIPGSDDGDIGYLRGMPGVAQATTSADGTFVLRQLPGGPYIVIAMGAAGRQAVASGVAAGRDDLHLVLAESGAVDGELVGFGGGTRVHARPAANLERFAGAVAGGRFSIRALPPGMYLVEARDGARFDTTMVEVTAGRTETVRLTSEGTATVRGRAIDGSTGAPLRGAHCGLIGIPPVSSDADGRFVASVPARRKATVACAMTARRSRPTVVELEPNASADVVVELSESKPR
jgi:hypothetical protein